MATENMQRTSSTTGIAGVERPAESGQDTEADERADHVDVAVREVQELQDSVDHRVAERDQRIQTAENEAVHGELEEEDPGRRAGRDRGEVDRDQRPSDQRHAQAGEVDELLPEVRVHGRVPTLSKRHATRHGVACGPDWRCAIQACGPLSGPHAISSESDRGASRPACTFRCFGSGRPRTRRGGGCRSSGSRYGFPGVRSSREC